MAVTSYGRNKNHDDEIKKHSRTSPEIQFKELNEKLRRTLQEKQINWTIQARTQTKSSQKNEKLKESKLNKIYSMLKLEAFKPKAKFFPFKNTYFKNMFKIKFCFWIRSSIISARPEKYYLALEDRWLTRKWPKNVRKKKSIAYYRKMLLKIVIQISSESLLCL